MSIAIYLFLALTVLGMNVVPAFMPATWSVLALFYLKYKLVFLPVIIIGASMATTGRIVLYLIARDLLRRVIPEKWLVNYNDLGKILSIDRKVTIPLVVGYAFLPIPSNQVFIAAGLAKADIKIIAAAFFFGRLLSYSFWVATASKIAGSLDTLFIHHLSRARFAPEILSFALIFVIGAIPWKKLLKLLDRKERKNN